MPYDRETNCFSNRFWKAKNWHFVIGTPTDRILKILSRRIPITESQILVFQKRFEKQLVILLYGINMFFFSY